MNQIQSRPFVSTEVVPEASQRRTTDIRKKALQEEFRELAGVIGPVPLLDLLFERSFLLNATDIHVDPNEQGVRIRLRVDGILHDVVQLPPGLAAHMTNRVKLLGGGNITERRVAQDGHISVQHQGRPRDIRVASGPTVYGERLVLRLMPDSQTFLHLDQLGFEPDQVSLMRDYLGLPYGAVLSVGPVGSGKSTTMYSCLEILNDPGKSLVTIEDPVERRVAGVNQVQVDNRIGFNFVEALRGVLRQDPNVMMIGEIRDPETAHIGMRAARTGTLVLSTMHSNDAASAVDMLRDFNISSLFIADGLQGVISQRLMRRICPACRFSYHPDERECKILGFEPAMAKSLELSRGKGCQNCFQTGYAGRVGVFEILRPNDEIRQAIVLGASRSQLMQMAKKNGMRTLQDSAIQKVRNGLTSVDELDRVLRSWVA